MKYITHKIVLVIQDLETKDGEKIAVVSGDVHYHRDSKEQMSYGLLTQQLKGEKDENKKVEIQDELLKLKHVASFQMSLDSNKDFQRHINSLVMEAISLKEKS